MITPYPHQSEFIDNIRNAFRQFRSVMGCAATGFGKTVVSAYIAQAAAAKGNSVIFTVHRDNLISQTSNTFREFGITHSFISAGKLYDPRTLVHIASIDTLKRRLNRLPAPDLLVVDEAHLAMADGWKLVVDHFKARGSRILGNSASPGRLDGRPLADLFDTIVFGPSIRWLMDNGFLSDYLYYAPSIPDLEKLGRRNGDYNKKKAGEAMGTPKLIGDVVKHYQRLAMGKRTVCFCMNVTNSKLTVEALNKAGIPAAHIDANTPKPERRRILSDFADGKILVLCNVELVTTGFDLSAQVGREVPVEAVILCRPTMSLPLFLQMVGRALRRKPYPAIIIDHAGCSQRHGFPDDEREWDMQGREKGGKGENDNAPPPPFTCTCFHQMRRPLPPECPCCGKSLIAESKPLEVAEGELVLQGEAEKRATRARLKRELAECKTIGEVVNFGRKQGYKYPLKWAQHYWAGRRRA